MMDCAVQTVIAPATGDLPPEEVLFGRSAAMQELKERLSRFCSASVPILLQGEVGVGKEVLSRFIYQRWFALHGHYAQMSCSSINEDWAAFALCAVMKCSASCSVPPGAGQMRPATLFLHEVNDLPAKLQRLLAVLMGERKENHRDDGDAGPVCIISSSTRNLRREMKNGRFRRDLLQQLAIGVLDVPPIRHRMQDLPTICEYLRHRCCVQAGAVDRPFPHDLMEKMLLYPWPGNLNELETFIRRFVTLGPAYCRLVHDREREAAAAAGQKWLM